MKQNICESQKRGLINTIDSKRGQTPGSRMVESLIARGMELENETSCSEVVE